MTSETNLPRFLFRVTNACPLPNGTLQVTSDIEHVHGYKSGDEVELRSPDGTQFTVRSGLVHVQKDWKIALSEPDRKWPLIFWLTDLKESDVPIGTEVWMLTEHPASEQTKGLTRFEKKK
jgi:hypothetical protein